MRELNDDWRDLRESTDVLSFPGKFRVDRPCGIPLHALHVLCLCVLFTNTPSIHPQPMTLWPQGCSTPRRRCIRT